MSARTLVRFVPVFAVLAALALAGALPQPPVCADEKGKPKDAPPARKPWTTSKVTGSPEPPPKYKSARVFPETKFHHPDLIARCPGSDRLFVGEQEGMIYSLANKPDAKKEVFFDLRKDFKALVQNPNAKGIGELYGLVFHPEFAKNRFCFVCYTLQRKDGLKGDFVDGSRVSRFKVTDTDPPRIDPASEEVIITFLGGGHNGGDLHFGPDGMLYISTGDGAGPNPPDPRATGQDCSDLLSSILRIDVERKDAGRNYSIPKDNPFVGLKDVRPEIWAFGFRNPWRMSFDRKTGDLWVGDVGWELWEMVYRVEKGGNYGWSITEARQPVKPEQKIGPTPIRPPQIEIPHTLGTSVTGGYVYRGKKFPELTGAYIFGDWETRRIWAARFEDGRLKEMPEIVKPNIRVSAFGEDNAGEIYYADYDTGYLYTLEKNDIGGANTNFPTKLSDTGIFADTAKLTPAEGVISFSPNARQWQDGATAEYLIALPNRSSVSFFEKPRPLSGQVFWHDFKSQFPPGAVLVKTISLDVLVGGRPVNRRVETQILHCDGEDWRGYTYAWRDDQSDADLVPTDGDEKVFEVPAKELPSGKREQVWTLHSRMQCNSCHSSWAEYALAFSPAQLNGPGQAKEGPNQLVSLSQAGVIRRVSKDDKPLPPFDAQSAAKEPQLVNPYGTGDTDKRARSYLHVNCAHCHRFGGGGGQVVLELDLSRPLKDTGILDVKPRQGDFGIPNARLIAPGDPHRSVLYYRMVKFGRGRMPHLGSDYPDTPGLDLMYSWISGLGGGGVSYVVPITAAKFDDHARAIDTALPYARSIRGASFKAGELEKLLAAAGKLEAGPVRELFEGYLPVPPGGRKLGSNPRPASILAIKGNAAKGEAIFFNTDMKCANCHRVGDKGTDLGPDLTKIGSTRSRAELLDSLLYPSARVEPQFAAYNIRTKDDKTYTGIVVKRDEKQLVLRDAENKEIKLDGENVEGVRPSRLSLMPDNQMSGLTPQEVADLLEYLVSRK